MENGCDEVMTVPDDAIQHEGNAVWFRWCADEPLRPTLNRHKAS